MESQQQRRQDVQLKQQQGAPSITLRRDSAGSYGSAVDLERGAAEDDGRYLNLTIGTEEPQLQVSYSRNDVRSIKLKKRHWRLSYHL